MKLFLKFLIIISLILSLPVIFFYAKKVMNFFYFYYATGLHNIGIADETINVVGPLLFLICFFVLIAFSLSFYLDYRDNRESEAKSRGDL